jgi:hypothetical protein
MPLPRKDEAAISELGHALAHIIQETSELQCGLLGSEPSRLLIMLQDTQSFKALEFDCIQNFEVLQCVMQRWGSRDICIDDLAFAIIKCDDLLNGLLMRAGKHELNGGAKFEAGKLKRSMSLLNRRQGRSRKARHPKITSLKLLVTPGPKGKKRAADEMASGSDDLSDDDENGTDDGEDPGTPPSALKSESEKRNIIDIDSDDVLEGNAGASLSASDHQACASSVGSKEPHLRPSQACASSASSDRPRPRPSRAPVADDPGLSQASASSADTCIPVSESDCSSADTLIPVATTAKALPREDVADDLCPSQATVHSVCESECSLDDTSTKVATVANALPREELGTRAGTTH